MRSSTLANSTVLQQITLCSAQRGAGGALAGLSIAIVHLRTIERRGTINVITGRSHHSERGAHEHYFLRATDADQPAPQHLPREHSTGRDRMFLMMTRNFTYRVGAIRQDKSADDFENGRGDIFSRYAVRSRFWAPY